VVGSAELIARARIFRKALGGGMRQAGVLAAAGLIALEQMPKRLPEDHANARLLAEALANIEGVEIDPETVETNIVIFRLTGALTPGELVARLKVRGVLASSVGPQLVRLVTHRDVGRRDCIRACEILAREIEGAQVVQTS
jgi:threonine aldolase